MLLIRMRDLTHLLADVNKQRRACRTYCHQYYDIKPSQLIEGTSDHVTCLRCLGERQCTCEEQIRTIGRVPESALEDGHQPGCEIVRARDAINERWCDIVEKCKFDGDHLKVVDDDGFCQACGYQEDLAYDPFVRDMRGPT